MQHYICIAKRGHVDSRLQRESILREINLDKNIYKLRGKIYATGNSVRGKSLGTGIVPVARYSSPLSSVLLKNSTH
jgi:hypothetical protein